MTEDAKFEERTQLIRLIRKIAREEAGEVIDEHLNDYAHRERAIEEAEIQE